MGGYTFATAKDVKPVCDSCKTAYHGDWNSMDCDYCAIPSMLELMEEYAKTLARRKALTRSRP